MKVKRRRLYVDMDAPGEPLSKHVRAVSPEALPTQSSGVDRGESGREERSNHPEEACKRGDTESGAVDNLRVAGVSSGYGMDVDTM
jgi:hypothetical protein